MHVQVGPANIQQNKKRTLMCGYLGFISIDQPVDREQFDAARDQLSHRGPDAAGSVYLMDGRVALGHRRLSIIDLSFAANQPMQCEELWVVYNGEIYNYPVLRKELESSGYVFRTHCDTEVLLHGYRAWGRDLPRRLAGMFSFCIWDDRRKRFLGARDHAGQKPFYFRHDHRRFIVASEPKAIFTLDGGLSKMRRESIKEFLIYDDIPDPFTWYDGLMSLPPGHRLEFKIGASIGDPVISDYWEYTPPVNPDKTFRRTARSRMGKLMNRSVQMHQLADVELGAFLSGGLDSSGVVALESRQRTSPVRTFSIGYVGDEGELPLARQVAGRWNCMHTESQLDLDGIIEAFNRSLDLFDMPFGDSSQFPTYELAKLASLKIKVVLTGDGGDEVFGGYWSLGRYMGRPSLDTGRLKDFLYGLKHRGELTRQWQSPYNFGHALADNALAGDYLGPEFKDLRDYDGWWFYKKHWLPELDPFRRAQWNDFKCYLPTVLKKVDRCTMAHSLEARCPILLPKLIEFAFNLPTEVRNPKGRFKDLYRSWLEKERLLPPALFKAEKKGFGISQAVADNIVINEYISSSLQIAIDEGWLSGRAFEAASKNWGCSWRMALIGRALQENRLS